MPCTAGMEEGETELSKEKIEKDMHTQWAGRNMIYLENTDSTNVQVKYLAEKGAARGTVVVAESQSAGRGRRGRKWESPAGSNLYFSLLLRENIVPEKASMLTLVMGLAVREAIAQVCGIEPKIKWPNDIVIDGRKIAGILTEMFFEEDKSAYVIIGTGINIKAQNFAPQLEDKAAFLENTCKEPVSRETLLAKILECFEEKMSLFIKTMDLSLVRDNYNAALVNCGREVRVLDPAGEYTGIAQGINEEGELLVLRPDETLDRVYAGEVSVRGVYGYV